MMNMTIQIMLIVRVDSWKYWKQTVQHCPRQSNEQSICIKNTSSFAPRSLYTSYTCVCSDHGALSNLIKIDYVKLIVNLITILMRLNLLISF